MLTPVGEELLFDKFVVGGRELSAVVSFEVLVPAVVEASGGRLLGDSETGVDITVGDSLDAGAVFDELIGGGVPVVVMAGVCVSVEGVPVHVFILGGVGGVGLVGGVGDNIGNSPFETKYNKIDIRKDLTSTKSSDVGRSLSRSYLESRK